MPRSTYAGPVQRKPGEPCGNCGHDFDDGHPWIPGDQTLPERGGIYLCSVMGCDCLGTWSVNNADPYVPFTEDRIAHLRTLVQMGAGAN